MGFKLANMERDFEDMSRIMRIVQDKNEEDLRKHNEKIDFVNIGRKVMLISELSLARDAQTQQVSASRLVRFTEDKVTQIDIDSMNTSDTAGYWFTDGGNITTYKQSENGYFAVKTDADNKVRVGDLNDMADRTNFAVGEETSFGFLTGSRFVHLDDQGIANINGEYAGLNRIKKRLIRKDLTLPLQKIDVSGNLVTVEELILNQDHQKEKSEPVGWIGSPPIDYYQRWYFRERSVYSARIGSVPNLILRASSGVKEEELNRSYVTDRDPKINLLMGDIVAHTVEYRTNMADAFHNLPIYTKLNFYSSTEAKILGSARVDIHHAKNDDAIAISQDAKIAYIGKRNGTVEVVNLENRPSAGKLYPDLIQQSWIEDNGSTAHLTSEISGDPYPNRIPPKSITYWEAHHDKAIKRIFVTENGVCTLDSSGDIRKWRIPKGIFEE